MNQPSKPIAILVSIVLLFCSCSCPQKNNDTSDVLIKKQVNTLLDSLNLAAAHADFKTYFDFYTEDAIFTGTDATERWDKKQFMAFAKPYFDKGRAWNFTSIDRHIYFDETRNMSWFDELLNTQMKICRGSGVLIKVGNNWKVQQYILSTTIPNEQIDSIAKNKAAIEDPIISRLSAK
ncbi:MAG: nuclear transport factor 2 family protein [Ferruginibacter sp.]